VVAYPNAPHSQPGSRANTPAHHTPVAGPSANAKGKQREGDIPFEQSTLLMANGQQHREIYIPGGTYIGIFAGEILTEEEADRREE
jgi:hypothetical protein